MILTLLYFILFSFHNLYLVKRQWNLSRQHFTKYNSPMVNHKQHFTSKKLSKLPYALIIFVTKMILPHCGTNPLSLKTSKKTLKNCINVLSNQNSARWNRRSTTNIHIFKTIDSIRDHLRVLLRFLSQCSPTQQNQPTPPQFSWHHIQKTVLSLHDTTKSPHLISQGLEKHQRYTTTISTTTAPQL